MGIIQRLIDSGNLALYQDYRSGSTYDFSGSGASGTSLANLIWNGRDLRFNGIDSLITCTTSGTGAYLHYSYRINKDSLVGIKRLTNTVPVKIGFSTASFFVSVTSSSGVDNNVINGSLGILAGHSYDIDVCVDTSATNDVKVYLDGVLTLSNNLTNAANGTMTLSTYNVGHTTQAFDGTIERHYISDSICTVAQIVEANTELENKIWPTKTKHRVGSTLWTTGYGVHESSGNTTGGYLENSDFQVDSGSFKISRDTIENQDCKVVECVTDGVFYIPTSYLNQTRTESAYGEWEIWVNKADTSNFVFVNMGTDPTGAGAGQNYNLIYRNDETIDLRKDLSPTVIAGGATTYAHSTWHKIKITRSGSGGFEIFVNDSSIGTATENTYTVSDYIVFSIDAGDCVAFADINGNHTIKKSV